MVGNTTLSGTNNLGSNPTVTLGSNAVMPSHSVVFADTTTLSGSGSQTVSFVYSGSYVYDTFYDTGLSLTINQQMLLKEVKF